METNITSYPQSESTIIIENLKPSGSSFQTVKNLDRTSNNGFIRFTIDEKQMNLFFEQFQFKTHLNNLRNDYCILAIKNLIKKNEFLQLSLQLSEKLISDSEFEKEIEQNPDKYIIQLDKLENPVQLHIISNILAQIGRNFTIDEVSELFSIDTRSIKNKLKEIGLK